MAKTLINKNKEVTANEKPQDKKPSLTSAILAFSPKKFNIQDLRLHKFFVRVLSSYKVVITGV